GATAARTTRRPVGTSAFAPVQTPLVNDRPHVQEAESVRSAAADFPRTVERAFRNLAGRNGFAPGRRRRTHAGGGSEFPLRFRRKAPGVPRDPAEPKAIRQGVVPRDAHDRLARRREPRIPPPGRLRRGFARDEAREFTIRHGGAAEPKWSDRD